MSRVRFGLPPDWSNAIPVHMFTNGFLYNSIRKKEQKQITLLKENNNTSFIFWKSLLQHFLHVEFCRGIL